MMKTNFLSNLPIDELTNKTDYLGILDKGSLMKSFLIGSKDNFKEMKMVALYGDWGSGKSSLMKYLQKELKSDFNTFFFEAWEFEKDDNLAMSLLEFLTFESESVEEVFYKDVIKYGGRIFRGLTKSVKIQFPILPNINVEVDSLNFLDEINKPEEVTFYKALEKFKSDFIRLEDFITKGDKPKYNLIFIDDLDRCEPEQVLNLLSAMKLFFTYGEKTIFFCGIDKKAVESAVKTKYGKLVKSNEYLEKIFDISFSMPEHSDIQKLINHYFDSRLYQVGRESIGINHRIHSFFLSLEFVNPRRVKKVLNKFQMLRDFRHMESNRSENFPNIDMKSSSEKSFFETILVLYLIILHEFYPKDFENFLNFETKKEVYLRCLENPNNDKNIVREILNVNFSKTPLSKLKAQSELQNIPERLFWICLSPLNIVNIHPVCMDFEGFKYITSKNAIDYLFYKYINSIRVSDLLSSSSDSNFISIKKLIKDLL